MDQDGTRFHWRLPMLILTAASVRCLAVPFAVVASIIINGRSTTFIEGKNGMDPIKPFARSVCGGTTLERPLRARRVESRKTTAVRARRNTSESRLYLFIYLFCCCVRRKNQRVGRWEGRCIGISEFSIDKEITKPIAER